MRVLRFMYASISTPSFRDAPLGRSPGIHNPGSWLWIPGSRSARPGMTGRSGARRLHVFRRHRVGIVVAEMRPHIVDHGGDLVVAHHGARSEEHTSELQSR